MGKKYKGLCDFLKGHGAIQGRGGGGKGEKREENIHRIRLNQHTYVIQK